MILFQSMWRSTNAKYQHTVAELCCNAEFSKFCTEPHSLEEPSRLVSETLNVAAAAAIAVVIWKGFLATTFDIYIDKWEYKAHSVDFIWYH